MLTANGLVFPSLGIRFFNEHAPRSIIAPSSLLSLYYAVPIGAVPILASLLPRRAERQLTAAYLVAATAANALAYSALVLTTLPPLCTVALAALANAALSVSLTPSLAAVVRRQRRSTAFGAWSASQNASVAALAAAAGVLTDRYGTRSAMMLFAMCGGVALGLALLFACGTGHVASKQQHRR